MLRLKNRSIAVLSALDSLLIAKFSSSKLDIWVFWVLISDFRVNILSNLVFNFSFWLLKRLFAVSSLLLFFNTYRVFLAFRTFAMCFFCFFLSSYLIQKFVNVLWLL